MNSTRVTLSPEMRARLAPGHSQTLQPAPNWDLPTLAGAGALRSSANDLLSLLSAALGLEASPLAATLQTLVANRRPTGVDQLETGLGWHVMTAHGRDLIWHNGGTGGYWSFIGYEPRTRVGVVVLANASTPAGADDIGRHLLDSELPLLPSDSPLVRPPATRTEIAVDPDLFDGYVGRYQLAPAAILTITRDGRRLFGQLTGQPAFEMFAESDVDYFLKVVDAQISFVTDARGQATALVLHQMGIDQRAVRIEGDPLVPAEVSLGLEILDRYVGRYRLAPGVVLTITREVEGLVAQLTGQPAFPLFASGEREFLYKIVDAQITFDVDAQGRATGLVLHQHGRDMRATRTD